MQRNEDIGLFTKPSKVRFPIFFDVFLFCIAGRFSRSFGRPQFPWYAGGSGGCEAPAGRC